MEIKKELLSSVAPNYPRCSVNARSLSGHDQSAIAPPSSKAQCTIAHAHLPSARRTSENSPPPPHELPGRAAAAAAAAGWPGTLLHQWELPPPEPRRESRRRRRRKSRLLCRPRRVTGRAGLGRVGLSWVGSGRVGRFVQVKLDRF